MPRVGQFLAPKYKELILELIVKHDMLTLDYLPHVTYNLFSPSLRELTLFKCQQVDDNIVKALGCCGAQFVTVKIDGCQAVTGEAQHWRIQGGVRGTPPGPISIIFMQFLANILPTNRLLPQTQQLPPPSLGNSGSATT